MNFSQLFETFSCLSAEVKALSGKFEDSIYVDFFSTPMASVSSSYSIKPSTSVEISDFAFAIGVIKMVLNSFTVLN